MSALILREVGSMLGMVEHIADLSKKVTVVNSMANSFVSSDVPLKKKVSFVRNNIKLMDKDAKEEKQVIEQSIDKINAIVSNEPTNFMSKIAKYIVTPVMTLLVMLFTPVAMTAAIALNIGDRAFTSIYNKIARNGKIDKKAADSVWTKKRLSFMHQWGMRYVARLGIGSKLSSAEIKFRKIIEVVSFSDLTMSIDKSEFTYKLSKMYILASAVITGLGGDALSDNASNTILKLKTMMRSNIEIFKSSKTIPSEVLMIYIQDYEDTMKLLNKISIDIKTEDKARKAANILKKILFAPMSIFSHNINITMKELTEEVEKLIGNPLYYSATKLDELAKKSK